MVSQELQLATAAEQMQFVAKEVARGASSTELWRFGILQILDDYESARKYSGLEAARHLFADEPDRTGHSGMDAAIAGLADWLSFRDQWSLPGWVMNPSRRAEPWWFVSELPSAMAEAIRDSPAEFKTRGVFIGSRGLSRA